MIRSPSRRKTEAQKRFSRLTNMLQRSMIYSKLLTERIQQQNEAKAKQKAEQPKRGRAAKKRAREDEDDDDGPQKRVKAEDGSVITRQDIDFAQPKLITGATMRDYQLAGVQWMTGLYLNRHVTYS